MNFYWHPNFHPATDIQWTIKLPEWVTFAQKNPNHPLAASQTYLNFIPVMPGWNISYSSVAMKESEPRFPICEKLLEFIKGNEEVDTTKIWRQLTLQTGFNVFKLVQT